MAILVQPRAFPQSLFRRRGPARVPRKGDVMASVEGPLHLGIDFGTSGARATVINGSSSALHEAKVPYDHRLQEEWDVTWQRALDDLFRYLPGDLLAQIVSVAFDGTSSTTMLIDENTGHSLASPQWYNASQSSAAVDYAKAIAPEHHPGRASTSTLCKVIQWHLDNTWQRHQEKGRCPRVLHQADWLSYLMHGNSRQSDDTNTLKLGYDPETKAYPSWLQSQEFFSLLPSMIVPPGTVVGRVQDTVQQKYCLHKDCVVCAGTTDSIAAFLASGAQEVGEAVTSLGSTLAIKMLSHRRVDAVDYGVYSHRLGDMWLVGGASNTGGAVLKQYFTDAEIRTLTDQIQHETPSQFDYYPLTSAGERFPINDPLYEPRLEPRPTDDALFLQGMLEGIASIEAECYRRLQMLGAGVVRRVWTTGGGAANPKWTEIRRRSLGVPVDAAAYGEASYGAALLAKRGFEKTRSSPAA